MSTLEPDRAQFTAAFRELSPRVYAYARRQCDAEDARDVVSETFLVAWRRWTEVPTEVLPWLLVVARNTIANRRRTSQRRGQLENALARLERAATPAPGADAAVLQREHLLTALSGISQSDRETLLLIAWDGLIPAQAALVLGCSTRAFEVRLSRARARLSRALGEPVPPLPSAPDQRLRRDGVCAPLREARP